MGYFQTFLKIVFRSVIVDPPTEPYGFPGAVLQKPCTWALDEVLEHFLCTGFLFESVYVFFLQPLAFKMFSSCGISV